MLFELKYTQKPLFVSTNNSKNYLVKNQCPYFEEVHVDDDFQTMISNQNKTERMSVLTINAKTT